MHRSLDVHALSFCSFAFQKDNVKDLMDKPNFEIIRHDITKVRCGSYATG